jgi:putative FmdB family regulatory protein
MLASQEERSVPTYQYACTECGHEFEAVQKFSDDALTDCPSCTGKLRKVYSAVGVVFKGSGFYRTDSRAGAKAESSKSESSKSSSDSSSGGSSSDSSSSSSTGSTTGSSAPAKSSGESAA